MKRFKIGDRIRCNCCEECRVKGTIESIHENTYYVGWSNDILFEHAVAIEKPIFTMSIGSGDEYSIITKT